jgi:DNA-binding transcriptional LysR family regulator
MAVSLDQLQVFITIADEGTFSAAARRLHRAQSAVSYAVGNLEDALGVLLFDRTNRRPTLTASGRALLVEARDVAGRVDHLMGRARSMVEGIEPQVSLVVDTLFPLERLVSALRELEERYPGVDVLLRTEALGAVVSLVLEGRCTAGIGAAVLVPSEGLVVQEASTVPTVAVVGASHPLAEWGSAPISDVEIGEHVQLVITDRSDRTVGLDLGVLSRRSWRLADLGAKHALLVGGFGWGTLPLHMVEDDLEAGRLVPIRPARWNAQNFEVPMARMHRPTHPPGPALSWLLDRLDQV